MQRSFKYKIIPLGKTENKALRWLALCRNLYNCALEHRISIFYEGGKTSYFDQVAELKDIRRLFPEYKEIFSQVLQDVLKRIDRSYQNFFRRLKIKNEKVGFPRFKGKNQFSSFTYTQLGFKIQGNSLLLSKLGIFKIRLHRPIEGRIKTCTIIHRNTGEWFVCFSCDSIEQKLLPKTGRKVGIDLGLLHFAVDSDGKVTEAPKFLQAQEKYMRRCQRSLSRKKKGGKNREKARIKVARIHDKITNQRRDFFHKLANYYVRNYDEISVEDLRIQNMMQNKRLSKSLADAALGMFLQILGGKAENAGRVFQSKNPRRTSMTCCECGHVQKMPLSRRIFSCEKCGSKKCRDHNAAINIRDFPAGAGSVGANGAAVMARCQEAQYA